MGKYFSDNVEHEIGMALVTRIGMLRARLDETPTPDYWQPKLDAAEAAFAEWNAVIHSVTSQSV